MMTPEQMAALAEQGRYWWMRSDGTAFYATTEYVPSDETDVYLLDASPGWVAQWDGDWSRAVDLLSPLFPKLDEYKES